MTSKLRRSSLPSPFSFSPSQVFEGSDGSWSTFIIRVGTPEQIFNVLISTTGQETWVPSASACRTDASDCGRGRGVQYFHNVPSNGFQINAVSEQDNSINNNNANSVVIYLGVSGNIQIGTWAESQ